MHPKIKIAVVLVHFGDPEITLRCLNSLRPYLGAALQIYLIDHDARDSDARLASYCQTHMMHYRAQENRGFASGCNAGAQWALSDGAEALLFLNNDTWLQGDPFVHFRQGHRRYGARAILSGGIRDLSGDWWYAGGHYSLAQMRVYHHHGPAREHVTRFISGCLMYVPAAVFRELQGFDTRYFLYWEDLDFCLRARQRGCSLIYLPQIEVRHQVSASTGRRSALSAYYQNRNRWLVLQAHGRLSDWCCFVPFFTLGLLKRCLSQPSGWRHHLAAAVDGWRGVTGKNARFEASSKGSQA